MCVSTSQNESLLWTEGNLEKRERGDNTSLCRPQLTSKGSKSGATRGFQALLQQKVCHFRKQQPVSVHVCLCTADQITENRVVFVMC